jgi:predicted nucleic acid-binding protein
MSRLCFDSCYVLKMLCREPDSLAVVKLVGDDGVMACGAHGRAEVVVALHRKVRNGELSEGDCRTALDRLELDTASGQLIWLSIGEPAYRILTSVYAQHGKSLPMRSADAMHLACAVEHGFGTVWSSDRQMHSGARAFGIECKAAGV